MADVDDLLTGARAAFGEQRWAEARLGFAAARELGALDDAHWVALASRPGDDGSGDENGRWSLVDRAGVAERGD